jgi:hypothetical protein
MTKNVSGDQAQTKVVVPDVEILYGNWLYKYWRPAIAWQYFIVCLFDFIIFPALTFATAKYTGNYVAWDPLTLKESGFYHLSMAAIIGVAAWTRGQEKLKGMELVEKQNDRS